MDSLRAVEDKERCTGIVAAPTVVARWPSRFNDLYEIIRIFNGCEVRIENSVTRVSVRHHSVSLVMPNSYPLDDIFNQHLTTIKDFYTFNWPR